MTPQQLRDLADQIERGDARVMYSNRDIVVEKDKFLGYISTEGKREAMYQSTHAKVSIEIEVLGPMRMDESVPIPPPRDGLDWLWRAR